MSLVSGKFSDQGLLRKRTLAEKGPSWVFHQCSKLLQPREISIVIQMD